MTCLVYLKPDHRAHYLPASGADDLGGGAGCRLRSVYYKPVDMSVKVRSIRFM